jgi:uncharacterized protein YkwD
MSRRALCIFAAATLLAVLTACTPQQLAAVETYVGVNAIRQSSGEPPLTPDPALSEVAQERSDDLAAKDYFSHFPPDGCNYACLIDEIEGRHGYAGENLAWNLGVDWAHTAEVAVQMWQDSPPHLENIVDCHYTRFGTGVTQGADNKIYFAMIFEGYAAC